MIDKTLEELVDDLIELSDNDIPTSWCSIIKTIAIMGYKFNIHFPSSHIIEITVMDKSDLNKKCFLELRCENCLDSYLIYRKYRYKWRLGTYIINR